MVNLDTSYRYNDSQPVAKNQLQLVKHLKCNTLKTCQLEYVRFLYHEPLLTSIPFLCIYVLLRLSLYIGDPSAAVMGVQQWLSENLPNGARVGFDPTLLSVSKYRVSQKYTQAF